MLQLYEMLVKKAVDIINYLVQPKYILMTAMIIFVFLLARNPFSLRTLIPNLEPYPDTFHYIAPARNLIQGKGFYIQREGRTIKPSVPPLYSFAMVPFYLINNDPRVYYLLNVLLSIVSLFIFYKIVNTLTKNKWLIGLMLILFITNFYLYWYPQWAMAENLILPLFLIGTYLLLLRITYRNIVLAGFITVSFYATKFASAPTSLLFFGIYLLKIFIFSKSKDRKIKVRQALLYLVTSLLISIPLLYYLMAVLEINHLNTFIHMLTKIFPLILGFGSDSLHSNVGNNPISSLYLVKHFPIYINGLFGSSVRFLWDFTPIMSRWMSILAFSGMVIGLFNKKFRLLSFYLLVLLLVQTIFVSSFYVVDMRYLYIAIPILLLGITIFFERVNQYLKDIKKKSLFIVLILIISFCYLGMNVIRIKNQVVLNLKYAETPWYYISVIKLNEFILDNKINLNNAYIISPMPPYYIDYFSSTNYQLLPLAPAQEFRSYKMEAWGDLDYTNFHKIYQDVLSQNKELYIATYGLGIEDYLHEAFNELNSQFVLSEKYNGCYGQCKIYQVEM